MLKSISRVDPNDFCLKYNASSLSLVVVVLVFEEEAGASLGVLAWLTRLVGVAFSPNNSASVIAILGKAISS